MNGLVKSLFRPIALIAAAATIALTGCKAAPPPTSVKPEETKPLVVKTARLPPTFTPAPTATHTPAPTATPTMTPTPTPYPGKFGMIGYDRMPRPQDRDSDGRITNSDIFEHLVHLGYIPPEYVDVKITPKDIEILGYRAILYELDDLGWGPIFVPTSDNGKSGFWIISVAGGPLLVTPTPAGPVVLWEDDFNAGLKFRLSIDKSVGCAEFPISRSDISYKIVSDPSSPSQDKNVLEVQANTKEMGGLYVNTVTHRDVQFFDKHNYLLYGYFRKVDRDEPERYQPEQINVSLTLGIGHVDHFGEIVWKLNPYDPNYGTISTRTGDVPNLRTIVLFKLGDDSHWHYFEIEYHYELPDNFTIRRIRVDNNDVVLDPPIPTATMKKPWFYSKPTISAYLEVGNMYTNCDPAITKVAIARFDRIGVKLIPPSQ